VLFADPSKLTQELGWCWDKAALANHWFNDDGCYLVWCNLRMKYFLECIKCSLTCPPTIGVRVRRVINLGSEWSKRLSVCRSFSREAKTHEGTPMKA